MERGGQRAFHEMLRTVFDKHAHELCVTLHKDKNNLGEKEGGKEGIYKEKKGGRKLLEKRPR